MFSDVAYELLPPNSPAGALLQFLRFFQPERVLRGTPMFGRSPWDQFSGGTRIAAGLKQAQQALRRARREARLDPARQRPRRLLRRPRAAPRGGPLAPAMRTSPSGSSRSSPTPTNVQIFAGLFGDNAFVDPSVFTHRGGRGRAVGRGDHGLDAARPRRAARPPARAQRAAERARRDRSARMTLDPPRPARASSSPSASPSRRSCSCSRSTRAPGSRTVTRDDLRFRALHGTRRALALAEPPSRRPGEAAARALGRARLPPRPAARLVQPRRLRPGDERRPDDDPDRRRAAARSSWSTAARPGSSARRRRTCSA